MGLYAVGAMTRPRFSWAPLPRVVAIEPAHANILRWNLEMIFWVGLLTTEVRVAKENTFV